MQRDNGDEEEQEEEEEEAPSSTPAAPVPRLHSLISCLSLLSLLGICSFLGLLIRLGLSAINTYPGSPVFPLIYAQMLGCAIMGMLSARRGQIEQRMSSPLVYTALTTGLCGSITTFSGWMLGVFEGFARIDRPAHGGFYNVSRKRAERRGSEERQDQSLAKRNAAQCKAA